MLLKQEPKFVFYLGLGWGVGGGTRFPKRAPKSLGVLGVSDAPQFRKLTGKVSSEDFTCRILLWMSIPIVHVSNSLIYCICDYRREIIREGAYQT